MREKRKRIKHELIGEVVADTMAYVQNRGSNNARKIIDKYEQLHIEIWYDKHYLTRVQLGENDGNKREGISEDVVQALVTVSISHLIYYSLKIKNFSFINFTVGIRAQRIVLRKYTEIGLLNVVVEFHHQEVNKYEVTVCTAMVTDDFRISDGQFVVLIDGDYSELSKLDNRKLNQIDSCQMH